MTAHPTVPARSRRAGSTPHTRCAARPSPPGPRPGRSRPGRPLVCGGHGESSPVRRRCVGAGFRAGVLARVRRALEGEHDQPGVETAWGARAAAGRARRFGHSWPARPERSLSAARPRRDQAFDGRLGTSGEWQDLAVACVSLPLDEASSGRLIDSVLREIADYAEPVVLIGAGSIHGGSANAVTAYWCARSRAADHRMARNHASSPGNAGRGGRRWTDLPPNPGGRAPLPTREHGCAFWTETPVWRWRRSGTFGTLHLRSIRSPRTSCDAQVRTAQVRAPIAGFRRRRNTQSCRMVVAWRQACTPSGYGVGSERLLGRPFPRWRPS